MRILRNFSWKTASHLFQLMNAKTKFQQYDYGKIKNIQFYGKEEPPIYPIHKAGVPVVLVYSNPDLLTTRLVSVVFSMGTVKVGNFGPRV